MTGPEGSVSERIRGNPEGLGLDAMASSAPEYPRLVATGARSFPEALLEMTDARGAAVRERDLGRRIEKASFPYVETLRDFDFSFQPSIPRGVVEDLAHAAGKGQLERRLRFYAHLSLLIVDEVGYLDVDKQGAGLLFQLVSRRHEGRSTIVTTNAGMGSWAKVFGDPVVASAIADRLCHHCHLIRITGRSYRTKDLAPQDRASPAVVADSGAPR